MANAQRNVAPMIRKLSTGDVMIFDRDNRDLYLIDLAYAESNGIETVETAQQAVKRGHARHFDADSLGKIQMALHEISLLRGRH